MEEIVYDGRRKVKARPPFTQGGMDPPLVTRDSLFFGGLLSRRRQPSGMDYRLRTRVQTASCSHQWAAAMEK